MSEPYRETKPRYRVLAFHWPKHADLLTDEAPVMEDKCNEMDVEGYDLVAATTRIEGDGYSRTRLFFKLRT